MPPKRMIPEPEEEQVPAPVETELDETQAERVEPEATEATVTVETRVAEVEAPQIKIKYCVFCDAKSTSFEQAGKDFRGKWICPPCVQHI
jgi:hypothetical protein